MVDEVLEPEPASRRRVDVASGLRQLPLFPGIPRPRFDPSPADDAAAAEPVDAPSAVTDERQLELFADRAVLARALDAAVASGLFEEAVRLRQSIDEMFGPETARSPFPLDRLAGVAWEGPAAVPLSVWAEIDEGLASQPSLRERLRCGVFARLLESHTSCELLEARPESLPALAHVLRRLPGRSPEEGRREARVLVRDALLAGRALDALDFRDDQAVAELLAEDISPRWLACLGRVRRLWPPSPPRDSEWEALREVARGGATDNEPAMAFWHCLRLAEAPACSEDLRRQARRRMKQLHPELHAQFMRHPAPA
jgi:hypothetical protein